MASPGFYELDERAQVLFRHLMQDFIRHGQPVSSKSLVNQPGLEVSSATIRNIMSHLEHLGLVRSPHTSAGRVPTEAGYRLFIDSMLEIRDLGTQAEDLLNETFSSNKTSKDLIQSASGILSQITQLTGLISIPKPVQIKVRHIEFMKLSDLRVLVILVINNDEVRNTVIQLDREYTDIELTEVSRMLLRYLQGRDFQQAKIQLKTEMQQHKEDVNRIMNSVLEVMGSVCGHDESTLLTSGESNLLQFAEMSDIERLRGLFSAFNQKRDLMQILDGCIESEGVQIFIGSESGYEILSDCSVIGAPYRIDQEVVGVLGVIGPTRIDYDRIIPAVDLTARLLTSALNSQN